MYPQNKGLIDNSSFIEINFEMQGIEHTHTHARVCMYIINI